MLARVCHVERERQTNILRGSNEIVRKVLSESLTAHFTYFTQVY